MLCRHVILVQCSSYQRYLLFTYSSTSVICSIWQDRRSGLSGNLNDQGDKLHGIDIIKTSSVGTEVKLLKVYLSVYYNNNNNNLDRKYGAIIGPKLSNHSAIQVTEEPLY